MDRVLLTVFGFLLGAFFQQYRAARSEEASLVNDHIKDIEKFSEAAQTYWLKKPQDAAEEASLAAKVRVTHAATTRLYENICRISEPKTDVYREKMQAIYRSATGGAFEQASRSIDPDRAIVTADMAHDVIHMLRQARIELLSVSHGFRTIKWWGKDLWRDYGPKP